MIAGTYTPFMLVAIGGAWGLGLLAFVWTVALCGVALKLFWPWRLDRLSLAAYLLLGWSIVVALHPLFGALSAAGSASAACSTASVWCSTCGTGCPTRMPSGTPSCWPRRPAISRRC